MMDEVILIKELIDYESDEESEEEDGMMIRSDEEEFHMRRTIQRQTQQQLNVRSLWSSSSGNRPLLPPTRPWFRTGLPISLRLHCCHFLIPKGTLLDFLILEEGTFYFTCMECCARVTMEQDPENLLQFTVKSGATIELGAVEEDEHGQLNAKPTLLSWGRFFRKVSFT